MEPDNAKGSPCKSTLPAKISIDITSDFHMTLRFLLVSNISDILQSRSDGEIVLHIVLMIAWYSFRPYIFAQVLKGFGMSYRFHQAGLFRPLCPWQLISEMHTTLFASEMYCFERTIQARPDTPLHSSILAGPSHWPIQFPQASNLSILFSSQQIRMLA